MLVTENTDDDGDYVLRKSFVHHITKKVIVAPPGKAFRIPCRKKNKPKTAK